MKKIIYVGLMSLSLLAVSCSQTENATSKTASAQSKVDTTVPSLTNTLTFDENGVATANPAKDSFIPALPGAPVDNIFTSSLTKRGPGESPTQTGKITYRLEGIWGYGGYEPRRDSRDRDVYFTFSPGVESCGGQFKVEIRILGRHGTTANDVARKGPDATWFFQPLSFQGESGNTRTYYMTQFNYAGQNLVEAFRNVQGPFGANFINGMNYKVDVQTNRCNGRTQNGTDCHVYFVNDGGQNGGRDRVDIYVNTVYGATNCILREIHDASTYGFQNW